MNRSVIFTLKVLRKLYAKVFRLHSPIKPVCEQDSEEVSRLIYDKLMDEAPCMIARFGSTELSTMVNYLGVKQSNKNIWKYIQGKSLPWWWSKNMINQMQQWSGFFPPTQKKIEQFCELMIVDMEEVDILGSWLSDEKYFERVLHCNKVHLRLLEPFWSQHPWTSALENKKILVIHPFAETIQKQYASRLFLFKNQQILPTFKSLVVIKAIQTLGGANENYADWFEALDSMKKQINEIDFDICLIGAGAYGFPLAAYVKKIGKKAVHLGGALQLLFGIRGKRWEDPTYGVKVWGIPYGFYPSLMNEFWTRPLNIEKPETAQKVEGACYW